MRRYKHSICWPRRNLCAIMYSQWSLHNLKMRRERCLTVLVKYWLTRINRNIPSDLFLIQPIKVEFIELSLLLVRTALNNQFVVFVLHIVHVMNMCDGNSAAKYWWKNSRIFNPVLFVHNLKQKQPNPFSLCHQNRIVSMAHLDYEFNFIKKAFSFDTVYFWTS